MTEILMAAFDYIPDPAKRRAVATVAAFAVADLYVLRQLWEE